MFLTVFEFTDLAVLLLQLLTDLLHRNVMAHGFGHFVDHFGGSVTRRSDVVTLTGDRDRLCPERHLKRSCQSSSSTTSDTLADTLSCLHYDGLIESRFSVPTWLQCDRENVNMYMKQTCLRRVKMLLPMATQPIKINRDVPAGVFPVRMIMVSSQ